MASRSDVKSTRVSYLVNDKMNILEEKKEMGSVSKKYTGQKLHQYFTGECLTINNKWWKVARKRLDWKYVELKNELESDIL